PGLRCRDLLGAPAHVLLPGQTARAAAGSMAALSVARLPVVESVETMRLAGIVSLRDLLRPSGHVFHEESRRERLRGRAAA
ncbi:MAG: CBS domain-containing protein, partial [Cupriavidus sp.]|nr:CBS domain-containing protein [Cupriavidus sp.]